MSALGEYLKLIPEGLKNPIAILEGVVKDVKLSYNLLPEDKKEEIIRRRLICEGCPFINKNAKTSFEYKELTGAHYTSQRKEEHCSLCGCPLKARTASLNKPCGISAWNSAYKEKQIPLKWDVYESKSS